MSIPGTLIRPARADEISLLSGLIRKSFRDIAARFGLTQQNCPKHPSNCTDRWVQDDFARGVTYYVLQADGSPTGCVALEQADSDTCYLERLAVLPESRRQGFGRLLVDQVFIKARELGAKVISIGIIAEQAELKDWYARLGFVEGETREFEHLPFRVTFMTYHL